MNNIDYIKQTNYSELNSLLFLMRSLARKYSDTTPHIIDRYQQFNVIKEEGLSLTRVYDVIDKTNDINIINKSIILQLNINILKNRITEILKDNN